MKRANNVLSHNGYRDFYSTVSQDFLVAIIFVATLLNSPLLRQDPCTPVHGILHVTCAYMHVYSGISWHMTYRCSYLTVRHTTNAWHNSTSLNRMFLNGTCHITVQSQISTCHQTYLSLQKTFTKHIVFKTVKQKILFCISYFVFPILPVPFWLSCSACPVLTFLFCLSRSFFPVLPVPFFLSHSVCPMLAVLFWLFFLFY